MLSRETGVPVEVLREAARERVTSSSLRIAAAEIGMSWKGLELFVGGTRPHPATVRKLTEWYLRRAALNEEEPTREMIAAAVAVIVRQLPLAYREGATKQLNELMQSMERLIASDEAQ